MSLGNESEGIVPMKINAGSSYKIGRLTPAVGITYRNKSINEKKEINIQAGVEFWSASEDIGLRGGYNTYEFTAGASFRFLSGGQIDYAFIYPISSIKGIMGNHQIGLTWKL